jgi:hypothetical protein
MSHVRRIVSVVAFVAASVALPTVALGQEAPRTGDEPSPVDRPVRVIYKSQTELDFDPATLTGELVAPSGTLIRAPRQGDFNPMTRFRVDFAAELAASVNEIR